jgi:membrane protease YdiL (CAAX protease family)
VGLFVLHNAWAAMLAYHLGMVAVLFLDKKGVDFKSLGKSRNRRVTLVMAAFGAAGGLLMFVLWPYLNVSDGIAGYLGDIGLKKINWAFFLVYFVAVNPWLEELYWRGYLGSSARRPVLNDFFFAGYHLVVLAGQIDVIWLAVVLILLNAGAWLWRQMDRLSAGLLPSAVSHAAADLFVMLVVFLRVY